MPDEELELQLAEPEKTDEYGRTTQQGQYIPQDMVQAESWWIEPYATTESGGLVTKDLTLSNLRETDIYYINITVKLVHRIGDIITNKRSQYQAEGLSPNMIKEKLKSLVDLRNEIIIENASFLTSKRAIKGEAAKLSRTARHSIEQKYSQEAIDQPKQKKGLRKLLPV